MDIADSALWTVGEVSTSAPARHSTGYKPHRYRPSRGAVAPASFTAETKGMSPYASDREAFTTGLNWLNEGHETALVTVAATWGSSPRPAGSLLVMRKDGASTGSVSGGCVEEDLIERYREGALAEPLPIVVSYGVTRSDASRFGLPCGGRLELVVERLDDAGEIATIVRTMENGELIARRLCLDTGEIRLSEASATQSFSYDGRCLEQVFGPRWRILIIGAGHLSRYVAQLALTLGYRVVVCDPRERQAANWSIDGIEIDTGMPDEAVSTVADHSRGIVLALTHDPKLDDMALLEALNSRTFYVGALGSNRTNAERRKRLATLGIGKEQIARLHGPVGLPLGGRTPAEIAIAIMAEITALRHGVVLRRI